jgi:predicted transcriptional regulator
MPDIGVRELAVLDLLWDEAPLTAQELQQRMAGAPVSLSTVQSTLERLSRKGLVARSKSGRAYRYAAVLDRSQMIGAMLRDLANDIARGDMAPMVSGFIEYVAAESPDFEAELVRVLVHGAPRR